MRKRPTRMFRRRKDCDVLIVPKGQGTNIILGDPNLEDLRGSYGPRGGTRLVQVGEPSLPGGSVGRRSKRTYRRSTRRCSDDGGEE